MSPHSFKTGHKGAPGDLLRRGDRPPAYVLTIIEFARPRVDEACGDVLDEADNKCLRDSVHGSVLA